MIILNLQMDGRKADNYSSNAQKIRVITEDWVNNGSITKLMGFRIPHIINSAHINEF